MLSSRRVSLFIALAFFAGLGTASALELSLFSKVAHAQPADAPAGDQPPQARPEQRFRYRCISLGTAFTGSSATKRMNRRFNEMAREGWRLTHSSIENGLACFEKRAERPR